MVKQALQLKANLENVTDLRVMENARYYVDLLCSQCGTNAEEVYFIPEVCNIDLPFPFSSERIVLVYACRGESFLPAISVVLCPQTTNPPHTYAHTTTTPTPASVLLSSFHADNY
uniref:Uncharacterized protein n=1 Tax=Palpitomonas bilix TaxID=652834 RepID=A0A7S3G3T8_9EUKA|mmetsp:Transcript_19707/g.50445  ORF Transcript_19707/g.50445 Transcript_19707/m.50445 type:complete len:115 (+) Transcript_19707:64-408(+)